MNDSLPAHTFLVLSCPDTEIYWLPVHKVVGYQRRARHPFHSEERKRKEISWQFWYMKMLIFIGPLNYYRCSKVVMRDARYSMGHSLKISTQLDSLSEFSDPPASLPSSHSLIKSTKPFPMMLQKGEAGVPSYNMGCTTGIGPKVCGQPLGF